jgi:integrase
MPRKRLKESIPGQFFHWLLGTRQGVYYADGRSGNPHNAGRHSLGTRDRQEALDRLRRLDLVQAVRFGLAKEDVLQDSTSSLLTLDDGRNRYLQFVSRPSVQGGEAPRSFKRFRAVLHKFVKFAESKGILHWQQVNKDVLRQYGAWLEDNDYHDKTQYTELTVLKQLVKWLVAEQLLPATNLIAMKLSKPQGTTTYCYSPEQVQAILDFCRRHTDLAWLADLIVALATTGLRIGEVADLRWSDVDLERGILQLTDSSRSTRKSKRTETRSTKSHRNRHLPIHGDLAAVLKRLEHHPDGRIFHGPKGGKTKPDTVRSIFKREVLPEVAQALPPNDCDEGVLNGRLHSFRHYFCSVAADHGIPEQMLMAWLGHRDSDMVRHYSHLRQDEARKQMAKIPFLIAPDVTGKQLKRTAKKKRKGANDR